jgi:hypothetical protein
MVHVLSRTFSARMLLILVPRAAPQAFLSHGFAAVIDDHSRCKKLLPESVMTL